MNLKHVLAAALAATCLTSTGALAQDEQATGPYVGLNVGLGKLSDARVQYYDVGGTFGGSGAEDTFDGRYEFDDAVAFGGVAGYDFGMLRADIEVSYARNKVKAFTFDGLNGQAVTLTPAQRADVCDYLEADTCGGSGNTFDFDGSRVRQLNAMANLWFDLPLGPVSPYAGGGFGVAGFEVDGEGEAKFAWQLGAGAALHLGPSIALTADYRHREVKATDVEFDDFSGFRLGKLKTDTFTAGLRFYFGGSRAQPAPGYVAPPPPPPAPAYEPAPPPPPPPVRPQERG